MWVLLVDEDLRMIARRVRPRERVLARLRSERLDHELACGAEPESSPLLAVRAQILVRPGVRRRLARSLRRVLFEASGPDAHPYWGKIPVRREAIAVARPSYQALVDALLAPGPVSAELVAQVKDLLTDGYGPLYHADALV